jgi:hypothetical protein
MLNISRPREDAVSVSFKSELAQAILNEAADY